MYRIDVIKKFLLCGEYQRYKIFVTGSFQAVDEDFQEPEPAEDLEMDDLELPENLKLEDGQKASRLCAINILAQVKKALNGDLEKVKNCVKITGFVNSTDDFFDQPKVINPASDIMSNLFAAKGKHARVGLSTNSLPLGAAVEIDAIFEI